MVGERGVIPGTPSVRQEGTRPRSLAEQEQSVHLDRREGRLLVPGTATVEGLVVGLWFSWCLVSSDVRSTGIG